MKGRWLQRCPVRFANVDCLSIFSCCCIMHMGQKKIFVLFLFKVLLLLWYIFLKFCCCCGIYSSLSLYSSCNLLTFACIILICHWEFCYFIIWSGVWFFTHTYFICVPVDLSVCLSIQPPVCLSWFWFLMLLFMSICICLFSLSLSLSLSPPPPPPPLPFSASLSLYCVCEHYSGLCHQGKKNNNKSIYIFCLPFWPSWEGVTHKHNVVLLLDCYFKCNHVTITSVICVCVCVHVCIHRILTRRT